MTQPPNPLDFFAHLRWIDSTPLLNHIEEYRRRIFADVLYTFDTQGNPRYNLALLGRAAKNWKSADALLAGLYRLLVWPTSPQGNDVLLVANDEQQAADDLDLAKKLITANPLLKREVVMRAKDISRRDGRGTMKILPAQDVAGMHGKTYSLLIIDEMHAYRDYAVLEALKPDPSRLDALIWITTYDSLIHRPGIPVYDLLQAGKAGDDERMYLSWYSGDFCTDPALASRPPEQRANPSMQSWRNPHYLAQQRRRLPTNRFRRLHLNLGGQVEGAYLDADALQACVVAGRRRASPQPDTRYWGFVDMSGGSNDEAALGVAHRNPSNAKAALDLLVTQTGKPPFNPRDAVKKFARILRAYRLDTVTGDAYAGETFRQDFTDEGIGYTLCALTKSDLYEAIEPRINAGEIELLDDPFLTEQFLGLTMRGARIDHASGEHDDRANAAAGALYLAAQRPATASFADALLVVPDDESRAAAFADLEARCPASRGEFD